MEAQGLASACLSFELRFSQIRDLKKLLPAEALRLSRDGALLTASLTEDGRETELRFLLRDGEAPA